jgi:RNA-dependent RNA polymerase
MQIFMRGIPNYTAVDDLKIVIARRIHRPPFPTSPPLNFYIDLFRAKSGSKYRVGILTLPDASSGELFLSTFTNGIPIGLHSVKFSRNNRPPDETRIAQVASTPWQDPEILKQEAEMKKAYSTEIPLATFAFGRLCRDGAFSAEVRRDGGSTVSCDIDNRRVHLTVDGGDTSQFGGLGFDIFLPSAHAWYRASQILALCLTDDAAPTGNHSIILEANAFPVFEKKAPAFLRSMEEREQPSQRVESLFGEFPMSPVGRFLLLTFETRDNLALFKKGCKRLYIRNPIHSSIQIVQRDLYSKDIEAQCQRVLQQLPYPLAFEVDKAIYSSTLDLTEVVELRDTLQKLLREKGKEAIPIFRWFTARIQAPSLQNLNKLALKDIQGEFVGIGQKKRKKRRQRGRKKNNRSTAMDSEMVENPTLSNLLEVAAKVYAPEVPRASLLIAPTPSIYQSYHLILTPSSRILDGPLPDQSSSILRRFGNSDCFLRVTFQDDNRMPLRHDTGLNISIEGLLHSRYKGALVDGIDVAGRHFEFLGYSMSGLKQHSVFFVHPFEFDLETKRTLMTAEVIRGTLVH